jgi:phospholipase C
LFTSNSAVSLANKASEKSPIEHIIVLMMENRSFDHLLGFLELMGLDGLVGNEYNLRNVKDPSSGKVTVNRNGYDTGPDDPGHTFPDTTEQIFGSSEPSPDSSSQMNGFVQNALGMGHSALNPMSMFTGETNSAPVINMLVLLLNYLHEL